MGVAEAGSEVRAVRKEELEQAVLAERSAKPLGEGLAVADIGHRLAVHDPEGDEGVRARELSGEAWALVTRSRLSRDK
jgi:hypothetical protein